MSKFIFTLVISLITFSALTQTDTTSSRARPSFKALLDKRLPDFSKTSLSGKLWNNDKIKGKVTLLNFWFIGCPPCMKEIEYLNQLNQEYKNKDFILLSLAPHVVKDLRDFNAEEAQDSLVPSLIRKALKAPVIEYEIIPVCDNKKYKNYKRMGPECNYILENFKTTVYPTTFIIDKKGFVKHIKTGFVLNSEKEKQSIIDEYRDIIDGLLKL